MCRPHEVSMQRREINVDNLFDNIVDLGLSFYSGGPHSMPQVVQDQVYLVLVNHMLGFNDFVESIIGLGSSVVGKNIVLV